MAGYNDRGSCILRDVAEVTDTFKERKSVIRFNGNEGVALLIRKEPGKYNKHMCGDKRGYK